MKSNRSMFGYAATLGSMVLAAAVAACASGGGTSSAGSAGSTPIAGTIAAPSGDISLAASPALRYPASAAAPTPDPRVGLAPGFEDAGEAIWNMRLVSRTPASEGFTRSTSSDIAFTGDYAILGNYNGFQIFDISSASRPSLVAGFVCPASQGDPSVYGNLLFVSGESGSARNDCGTQGVEDSVSVDRFRGIRILDISDPRSPTLVKNVQTCRGSHTHSLVEAADDPDNIYVYVSGYSRVRSPSELAGCMDAPADDPRSARFRIEVIKVPLANPEEAAVVNSPHLLADLIGRVRHAEPAEPGGRGGRDRSVDDQPGERGCHDITAYSHIGLAGGACMGYGLLFDIRDPENPERLLAVSDSNMSFWHSATFNNDGDKVLFSDEWGGGGSPRCRASDPLYWGANAIFTLEDDALEFQSYAKMSAAQTNDENCTAHNGSLIPIPGRDVMVQSYYQGGVSVFDFTDAANPIEIAFYDLGPNDEGGGGFWSAYWYNGVIVGSEMRRGMYIWELTPNAYLSQNEIDAALTVRFEQFNPQDQPHIVWPSTFSLARAYVDQLERNAGLSSTQIEAVRSALDSAEGANGSARSSTLSTLASSLISDVQSASDRGRVARLARVVQDLASGG